MITGRGHVLGAPGRLHGIKACVSDADEGIKAAISKVRNAIWQRCRVPLHAQCAVKVAAGASSPPSSSLTLLRTNIADVGAAFHLAIDTLDWISGRSQGIIQNVKVYVSFIEGGS